MARRIVCRAPRDEDGLPCGVMFVPYVNRRGEAIEPEWAWRDHYARTHERDAYRPARRDEDGNALGWL